MDLGIAFEKIIEENVLPMYDYLPQMSWQRWRENNLWNVRVNDLYESNIDTLKQYYQILCTNGECGAVMSRDVAMNTFIYCQNIELPFKLAQQAFGLSKMTVPYENEDGPAEYE